MTEKDYYSKAIKGAKNVLKYHIESKALIGSNGSWTIDVGPDGKVDGLLECTILKGSSLTRLVNNYFGFLEKRGISVLEAFKASEEYFPETYVDVVCADQIKNVHEYLIKYKPEELLI